MYNNKYHTKEDTDEVLREQLPKLLDLKDASSHKKPKLPSPESNCQKLGIEDVLLDKLPKFLEGKDLSQFANACKGFGALFKESLSVQRLLIHVARGEQREAEAMVKENPKLLLKKGNVTDYSYQYFLDVTPFQLALRNLDANMWKMFLKYFPQEEKNDNTFAAKQLEELMTKGINYQIINRETKEHLATKNEIHFDFQPLILALQNDINSWLAPWPEDIDFDNVPEEFAEAREKESNLRTEQVELAQRVIPVHLVKEFWQSFDCDFKLRVFPFVRQELWLPLGRETLNFLINISQTRIQEFEELKQQLLNEKPIADAEMLSLKPK